MMSRQLLLPLAVSIVSLASPCLAGPGTVGNGGDAVRCAEVAGSPFKGLYSLDYLMTYESHDSDAAIVQVFNWAESYKRLSQALAAADPDLSASFEDFVSGMDNFSDWTQPKIWREASFGLVQINDQNIIRKLPPNCYTLGSDGTIAITQTVVQTQRPDQIEYDYDPAVYTEFQTFAPLQFSFLMVHEWLWELTGDVQVIRNMDFFLHSADATTLAPPAFRQAVLNIGINLAPSTFKSVCARNAVLRDQIVAQADMPCANITPTDLVYNDRPERHGVLTLIVSDKPLGTLAYDDLSSLTSLNQLTLHNVGLTYLYSHAFDQIENLGQLDLSNNHLKVLDGELFANTKGIWSADFSNNQLSTFPAEFFLSVAAAPEGGFRKLTLVGNHLTSLPSLSGLTMTGSSSDYRADMDFSGNQLTDAPPELCQFARGGGSIDLRGNPLTVAAKQALTTACGGGSGKLYMDP